MNFRILHLFWIGKLLINNPWCFDYCMDREEQRVDELFQNGCLIHLEDIDLSAFYQTVDDKAIQLMCMEHLSSQSMTVKHLLKVRKYSYHCGVYHYMNNIETQF